MNGKPNSGQINSTCSARPVGHSGKDSPQAKPTGKSIPGVSGSSSGSSSKTYSGVPGVAGCKEGSPEANQHAVPAVTGEMRTPITGYGN